MVGSPPPTPRSPADPPPPPHSSEGGNPKISKIRGIKSQTSSRNQRNCASEGLFRPSHFCNCSDLLYFPTLLGSSDGGVAGFCSLTCMSLPVFSPATSVLNIPVMAAAATPSAGMAGGTPECKLPGGQGCPGQLAVYTLIPLTPSGGWTFTNFSCQVINGLASSNSGNSRNRFCIIGIFGGFFLQFRLFCKNWTESSHC